MEGHDSSSSTNESCNNFKRNTSTESNHPQPAPVRCQACPLPPPSLAAKAALGSTQLGIPAARKL
eukprot:100664-Chlamydomonas_euryale.AAC.4